MLLKVEPYFWSIENEVILFQWKSDTKSFLTSWLFSFPDCWGTREKERGSEETKKKAK